MASDANGRIVAAKKQAKNNPIRPSSIYDMIENKKTGAKMPRP